MMFLSDLFMLLLVKISLFNDLYLNSGISETDLNLEKIKYEINIIVNIPSDIKKFFIV